MIVKQGLDNAEKVAAILERNQLKPGFGAMDAMMFVPSQPYHWIGLAVLRRHPSLWLLLTAFAVFAGWVAYEILEFVLWNGGRLLVAESRLVLLPKMLAFARMLPALHPLIIGLIAAIPMFVLGNVLLSVACGVIARQRPSWRWLWVAPLGMVPLRFIADYFMPRWAFWAGEWRGRISIEARMLQFSVIYGVVCRMSKVEVETRWVEVFDTRLKDIFDSLYSYAYVVPLVAIGVFFSLKGFFTYVPYEVSRPVDVVLESINFVPLISAFVIWLAVNRFLLAITVFALLREPAFPAMIGGRWWRFSKMVGIVVMLLGVMYTAIFTVGGMPRTTLNAEGLTEKDYRRFFSRNLDGPGVFNGFWSFAVLRYCFDSNKVLKGVLANDGSVEQVAEVKDGVLRYLPDGVPAQLGCSHYRYEPVMKE